jgi:phospholipid/cholesterol/gamma-HCH transport system substrate-binding protein
MKRKNDFLVGLSIIVGTVAVLVATMWVSQSDFRDRRSRLTARMRDAGNAQVGNAVVIRGVRAGRIETIDLADDGWVHVTLGLDPEVPLPPRPVVLLYASSLFGEWQASVIDRSAVPNNRHVQEEVAASEGAPGLAPGGTLPDIAQLTAVAGSIAGDVASVADRVQTAFDDRAARELRASIRNVADLSTELARTVRSQSRNLDALSVDVRGGVQSLTAMADALNRTATRIDSSTSSGDLRTIVNDVAEAARQLRETTLMLHTMSGQLAKSQVQLDLLLAHSDSVMAKVNDGQGSLGLLVNNPSLYQNSDSLVRQLRALIADVHARPGRYVNLRIF